MDDVAPANQAPQLAQHDRGCAQLRGETRHPHVNARHRDAVDHVMPRRRQIDCGREDAHLGAPGHGGSHQLRLQSPAADFRMVGAGDHHDLDRRHPHGVRPRTVQFVTPVEVVLGIAPLGRIVKPLVIASEVRKDLRSDRSVLSSLLTLRRNGTSSPKSGSSPQAMNGMPIAQYSRALNSDARARPLRCKAERADREVCRGRTTVATARR